MRRPKDMIAVFPEYLDKNLPRSRGRRLPRSMAVENPTLEEIQLAAKKLNLDVQVRPDAAYPRNWWERRGLALVKKNGSKLSTLKSLAREIEEYVRPMIEQLKKEQVRRQLLKREQERKERLLKSLQKSSGKKIKPRGKLKPRK